MLLAEIQQRIIDATATLKEVQSNEVAYRKEAARLMSAAESESDAFKRKQMLHDADQKAILTGGCDHRIDVLFGELRTLHRQETDALVTHQAP